MSGEESHSSEATSHVSDSGHVPVLAREIIQFLSPNAGETVVDCTAGRGGHAALLARAVGPAGTIVLNDLDRDNLSASAERVRAAVPGIRVIEFEGSFAEIARKLAAMRERAHIVLADLGFASSQMEDPARGLSFNREGPLDMRYDRSRGITAGDIVNRASEAELEEILRDFGEERRARGVARKLVAAREAGPIETTSQLAELVRQVVGVRSAGSRIDPATRSFQALRIAVNDELGNLQSLLDGIQRAAGGSGRGESWLAPGARIGIISFHSLEDRLVKNSFRELVRRRAAEDVSRGAVTAGEEEQATNPRSRSAKLRVIRLSASTGKE